MTAPRRMPHEVRGSATFPARGWDALVAAGLLTAPAPDPREDVLSLLSRASRAVDDSIVQVRVIRGTIGTRALMLRHRGPTQ